MTNPREILDRLNANNFKALYHCRWSPQAAGEVVPDLAALLQDPDARIVAEALRALHRIGPEAFPAVSAVLSTFSHSSPIVRSLAVSTLASLCLEHPSEAIPTLTQAADQQDLLVNALFALIAFGPAAASAAPLFCRTYTSRRAKLRRLAVRGLLACGASDAESLAVLSKARSDASAEVRKAAMRKRGLP